MNLFGAIISASAMAVAPPPASLGQPAGLGAAGSVAMLIRNRRGPSASLRRRGLASFVAFMLLAPSQGSAQTLQSFEDLALRVNLDDQLQVEDQSGVRTTGRLHAAHARCDRDPDRSRREAFHARHRARGRRARSRAPQGRTHRGRRVRCSWRVGVLGSESRNIKELRQLAAARRGADRRTPGPGCRGTHP